MTDWVGLAKGMPRDPRAFHGPFENPWVNRAREIDTTFGGTGLERRIARDPRAFSRYTDIAVALETPPEQCPYCGEAAWYWPSVGTVVCPNCRAMRLSAMVDRLTGTRVTTSAMSGEEADERLPDGRRRRVWTRYWRPDDDRRDEAEEMAAAACANPAGYDLWLDERAADAGMDYEAIAKWYEEKYG